MSDNIERDDLMHKLSSFLGYENVFNFVWFTDHGLGFSFPLFLLEPIPSMQWARGTQDRLAIHRRAHI